MSLFFKPQHWLVLPMLLLLPSLAAAQQSRAAAPSAFSTYRTFVDEPVANWKSANDTVARIGGWRAYAKEAAVAP